MVVETRDTTTTESQRTQWTCLDFVDTLKDPDDTSGKEVFMSQKRRQFTREFKLEAVRLVKSGQSVSRVAAQLGIRSDMLRTWKRQVDGSDSSLKEVFRGHGRVTSQEQELRRLRHELARVTEERDFLKKAAAYFAKEKS